MKCPFIFAFALCACAFALLLVSKPDQGSASYQQQTNQNGQRWLSGTDDLGSATKQDDSQNKPPHWYASPEWVLVIVGGITFIVIACQTYQTRRTADAAVKSIAVAELSMGAANRAYIHHHKTNFLSHVDQENRVIWSIRPIWKNCGNTPTRQLRLCVEYNLLNSKQDFESINESSVEFVPVTIPPNGEFQSEWGFISGDDIMSIVRREKFFFVSGIARYWDMFPETKEHLTKFCIYISSVGGNPLAVYDKDANPVELNFVNHYRHNCSDEECEEQPTQDRN
jgi:hypothetical protein